MVEVATGVGRCVHHTDGTLPKLGAAAFAPAWSPDGRVVCGPLLYRADRQAPGLTVWSGDGVAKRQVGLPEGLGPAPADTAIERATWSPDARHLAVVVRTKAGRRVLVIAPASGSRGQIVAKDVVAHRWLDASHVWLLQRSGSSYLTAGLRALVSDLQGNLKPAKEPFPILLLGDWDLSRDAGRVVMCGPEVGGKGLWVCDLRGLRP
jgi:hypothetical protein